MLDSTVKDKDFYLKRIHYRGECIKWFGYKVLYYKIKFDFIMFFFWSGHFVLFLYFIRRFLSLLDFLIV